MAPAVNSSSDFIFGIAQRGGVFVPIHHQLVPDQVVHIANDCGMKALIMDPEKNFHTLRCDTGFSIS